MSEPSLDDIVTVNGNIEGASYSGCEGWHTWHISRVEVTGPRKDIRRLMQEKEKEVQAQAPTYTRREIDWDEDARALRRPL